MLDDVVAAQISGRVLVPQHVAEHPLHSPGSGIADLLGKLPAVLAFRRAQQALQVQARLTSWLSPDEQLHPAAPPAHSTPHATQRRLPSLPTWLTSTQTSQR